jgi:hypothetical protein
MITQGLESTKDFMKEWDNSVYFRLNMSLWIQRSSEGLSIW